MRVDVHECLLCNVIFVIIMDSMEVFSLEEEEGNDLFVTQQPREVVYSVSNHQEKDESEGSFLGLDVSDFASPCVSLVKPNEAMEYSDISDAEPDNKEPTFE